MKIVLTAIVALMLAGSASAQSLLTDAADRNRAYLRLGIEPTTMAAVGFQHNIAPGFLGRALTTYGEWSTSVFRFGFDNSELKAGGIVRLYGGGAFKIVTNLGVSAGSVTTHLFDSRKFAIADEMAFGLYGQRWFGAATIEYEKILLNKIDHTDYYRTTYYPDAEDGWYSGGGGMIQVGIEGGRTLWRTYDLHLEIKLPFTETLNAYGGSPLHANLGFGYRF